MLFSCCRANDAVVGGEITTPDKNASGRPQPMRKALHLQFSDAVVVTLPQTSLISYSRSAEATSSSGAPLGLVIQAREFPACASDSTTSHHSRSVPSPAHDEDDRTKLNHVSADPIPSTHQQHNQSSAAPIPHYDGDNSNRTTTDKNKTETNLITTTYPVIQDISAQSPFQATSLQVGMVILQIEETATQNLSMERVKELLLESFRNSKTGQSLSLRAATPLSSSTSDDSISKRGRRRLANAASLILKAHQPQLRITEGHGDVLASRSIVAVAHKEQFDQDLGLTLKRTENGTFVVERIDTTSPFYARDTSLLREGMYLTSINGLIITGRDIEVALSALRDAAPGYLVVTAELPREMKEPAMLRKRVEASVQKNAPGQSVGLSLLRLPLGGSTASDLVGSSKRQHHKKKHPQTFITVVGRIGQNSPFAQTSLKVGMELVSVNGLDVAKSDARSILRYLQEECSGGITIHAEMDVPAEETVTTEPTTSLSVDRSSNMSQGGASGSQSSGIHYQRTQPHVSSERSYQAQAPSTNTGPSSVSVGEARTQPHTYPAMIQDQAFSQPIPAPSSSVVRPLLPKPLIPASGTAMLPVESSSAQSYRSNYSASSNSSPYPGILRVYAWKHSHNQRLGVLLSEDSGSFFVSRISADGIFAGTDLVLGAEIMSLNGVQLFGTDLVFVATLMQSIVGEVVLEYLPPSSASGDMSSQSSSSSLAERGRGHD